MRLNPSPPFRAVLRLCKKRVLQHELLEMGLRSVTQRGVLPKLVWSPLRKDRCFRVDSGEAAFLYASHEHDLIGNLLYWRGVDCFEPDLVPIFERVVRRIQSTFIDIGANTGFYTLLACAHNPSLRVVAAEPHPLAARCLRENIGINLFTPRCRVWEVALSDSEGRTHLHVPTNTRSPTSASLHPNGFRGLRGRLIEVDAGTLDRLVPQTEAVGALKIDVEGFEGSVLRGGAGLLRRCRPVIFCEILPDGCGEEIDELLSSIGYDFYQLTRGDVRRCERIAPRATDLAPNWLLLPRSTEAGKCG